jgi:ABC-type Fe3+ transport system substrate-binding protein
MTDLLAYASVARADAARALLTAACQATGATLSLELYGSGSLYQRLGPRHWPPTPDIALWFGPFAAQAAAIDGLIQAYQPAQLADLAAHAATWHWTAVDYSAIGVVGSPAVATWSDVTGVPRLAVADPERSEVGLSILLATLDRARQVDGDLERGWIWWQQRAASGLVLAEDDASAVALVQNGVVSHALTLSAAGVPIDGLAPIPHALSLTTNSRSVDAARGLIDWLTSEQSADAVALSPWQAARNGLGRLLQAAPPLDVEWGRQQYTATRQRWSLSAFGPTLAS